MIPTKHTHIKH